MDLLINEYVKGVPQGGLGTKQALVGKEFMPLAFLRCGRGPEGEEFDVAELSRLRAHQQSLLFPPKSSPKASSGFMERLTERERNRGKKGAVSFPWHLLLTRGLPPYADLRHRVCPFAWGSDSQKGRPAQEGLEASKEGLSNTVSLFPQQRTCT